MNDAQYLCAQCEKVYDDDDAGVWMGDGPHDEVWQCMNCTPTEIMICGNCRTEQVCYQADPGLWLCVDYVCCAERIIGARGGAAI